MIVLRKAGDRGHFDHGWLDTYHTFSFAQYYDPGCMGFRTLRVLNEDRVQPGNGFPTHPHRDMEIVTYVLEGALEHRDSMGNGSVIRPGEVQRLSAGTGVTHSEYNASGQDPVHFLQIWILPGKHGLTPSYQQTAFPNDAMRDELLLVASPDGRDGSVTIHQDVNLYATRLHPGRTISFRLSPGRSAWVQLARGTLSLNDESLDQGDGVGVTGEELLRFETAGEAEVLLFDLA
jgi:redox-sensitive bicupin YhaK (pirin superfamily)